MLVESTESASSPESAALPTQPAYLMHTRSRSRMIQYQAARYERNPPFPFDAVADYFQNFQIEKWYWVIFLPRIIETVADCFPLEQTTST